MGPYILAATLITALIVLLIAIWFFERVDRLLYVVETVNKIPPEQVDPKAPTDEEFKRQAHDFLNDDIKKESEAEIVIEKLEDGRRINVKPAEKKAEIV
jgi:hypothetical protein